MATRVDPESERPAFVPDKVPPLLLKSMSLVARAGLGSMMQKTDIHNKVGSTALREKVIWRTP
jgi:hypothetical protein